MSIRAIVRNYQSKFKDRARDELDWFRDQSDIRSAIENAALARDRRGKRYSHQRRLNKDVLAGARSILLSNQRAIESVKDFDELISLVTLLLKPLYGTGDLYVYDTSLRMGAKLGLLPEKIYLHAGTRDGAEALGISSEEDVIDPNRLPEEFQELEPYEIEDVLCIYKDILKKENR